MKRKKEKLKAITPLNLKKKNDWEKKLDKKMDEFGEKAEKAGAGIEHHFKKTRWGRVTGYGFSIFWSAVFLILFNYYNQYIAYYNYSKTTETWIKYSFLTEDFSNCLPIITVALSISIIGNILLIIYDKYFFRQIIHMVLDLFSLTAVITLLTLFPFDFSVFPNTDLTGILTPIITVVLILIAVGLGIGIIVRFVKLVIGIAKCS